MGELRILSHSFERFRDRHEAGQLLSRELTEYRGQNMVVLGIPRGGVIVASELARGLDAELDIVLARKLGTPGQEELAMGAVAENGHIFLNDDVVRELGIDQRAIEREKSLQLAEIERRSRMLRKIHPRVPLQDRAVIVTDDGVATGATFQAALWAARQERPRTLIAAIPVGSNEALRRLAQIADVTVCLRAPVFFAAVGQFYSHFEPVDDEDVLKTLQEKQARAAKE